MIFETTDLTALTTVPHDVVIVGAGPLGLMTAMRLERRGLTVLVLESGARAADPQIQALSRSQVAQPAYHSPSEINMARRIGGTSHLWGGRCLPFDPIDFDHRPFLDGPDWPLGYDDLVPYFEDACAFFSAGKPDFQDPIPGLTLTDERFRVDALERWATNPSSMALHGRHIEASRRIHVASRVTVTGLDHDGSRITGLSVCFGLDPARHHLPAPWVILAGGGNEIVRLLLAAQRERSDLFGGADGPLGRYYMGHVNGQIADIVFSRTGFDKHLDFYVDRHGSYVRRRFVPSADLQRRENLLNVAFWPVVPEVRDHRHRSGPLSAAFLALSIGPVGRQLVAERIRTKQIGEPPYDRWPHVMNILRDPVRFAGVAPWLLWNRKIAKRRLPGFFLRNSAARYGLEFHSEQWPNPDSRITLGRETDALGLPRLEIDYFFHERDTESIIRAHRLFEGWLEQEGIGRLDYRYPKDALAEGILEEANHGVHQIGTARMAASARGGVVDADGRTFSFPNLMIASTAVLPTSGQANPTFTAGLVALRMADRFAARAFADRAGTPSAAAHR